MTRPRHSAARGKELVLIKPGLIMVTGVAGKTRQRSRIDLLKAGYTAFESAPRLKPLLAAVC